MEDILGGWSDPRQFDRYLSNWHAILDRRVDETLGAVSTIPGICGILLAGSVGRGDQWPLSDIDLIAIFEDASLAEGKIELESRCLGLTPAWLAEGWWTGVDAGKLSFGRQEISRVLGGASREIADLLQDDRWYHSLDKGFQSRPVFDRDARTDELSEWLTKQRFNPSIVQVRLTRERAELVAALERSAAHCARNDVLSATMALRRAGEWLQIWYLEHFGIRDASLARVGTRFERLAGARGNGQLIDLVNDLSHLDPASMESRMNAAPEWVWEWHDRAWRSRRLTGEPVTPVQHRRDVLRVCSRYELRRVDRLPAADWLAIPSDVAEIEQRSELLRDYLAGSSQI